MDTPNSCRADPPHERVLAISDILITISLPVLFFLAWFTPVRAWQAICRNFAPAIFLIISRQKRDLNHSVRMRVGQRELAVTPEAICRGYLASHIERKLLTMRLYRPGAWAPTIHIMGQQHIESALQRGNGAVLWDSNFAYASLLTKMALFQQGFRLIHLSQPSHGFDSSTRYGVRFLNPIIWSMEARFLSERVELSPKGSAVAMRTLVRRLKSNGIVSITVRNTENDEHRFPFVDDEVSIAPGAPYLSSKTGAALLPVFTTRDECGDYLVTIEPPIDLDTRQSTKNAIQAASAQYARRLEPYVLQRPEQWMSWSDR
jgi:lauroyl/myristoyl acyltransferase